MKSVGISMESYTEKTAQPMLHTVGMEVFVKNSGMYMVIDIMMTGLPR
jgi:hypothetical protein